MSEPGTGDAARDYQDAISYPPVVEKSAGAVFQFKGLTHSPTADNFTSGRQLSADKLRTNLVRYQ